jgi:hypothetical protein
MIGNRIEVGEPADVASPGEGGFAIDLPYTVSPIEAPADGAAATSHRLRIRLSRSKAAAWQLSDPQARAAMIELGLAHLLSVLREREPREFEALLINSETFPGACPFDPGRVTDTTQRTFEVERAKKPTSF